MIRRVTLVVVLALAAEPVLALRTHVVAEFEPSAFLESGTAAPDGSLLVTSYLDGRVLRVDADGTSEAFAVLDVHPVGLLATSGGYAVSFHATAFTDPGFGAGQGVMVLSPKGVERGRIEIENAGFLNGLASGPDGSVLVADSVLGAIWRVDLAAGTARIAFADPRLAPDESDRRPGANGLKWDGASLLVSNSSRETLVRIETSGRGLSDAAIGTVVSTGSIDDFWVDDDGVVFATHGATLERLERDGRRATLLDAGCDGCTAVLPAPDPFGPGWIVLTTGNLLEGRTDPARILRVTPP